ncbi:MAG: hypothetical protein Q9219_007591 [cf. Caloplaca sp. 3 TL-2023]
MELHNRLENIPLNLIPSSLKSTYNKEADTPQKSQAPPRSQLYTPSSEEIFLPTQLPAIKKKVDEVLKDAEWNIQHVADEGQWGDVAHLLLTEVASWPRTQPLKALNTQRCLIGPSNLYTLTPGGPPLKNDTASLSKNTDTDSEKTSEKAISKMTCDPTVQQAVWKSAWLLKALHHGWDTSLPLPEITVVGHLRSIYLFMAADKGVVMMGPFSIGTTADVLGVWTILYRLRILFDWGAEVYGQWFHDHVLVWAENLAAEGEAAGLGSQAGALSLRNQG